MEPTWIFDNLKAARECIGQPNISPQMIVTLSWSIWYPRDQMESQKAKVVILLLNIELKEFLSIEKWDYLLQNLLEWNWLPYLATTTLQAPLPAAIQT